MTERFQLPVAAPSENFHGREGSTQAAYVEELWRHFATIPDTSRFPSYYSPTREEAELLGRYCTGGSYDFQREGLMRDGIVPLHREDVIDPLFCQSVDEMTRQVTGNSPQWHWYKQAGGERGPYVDPSKVYTSRRWELFYVDYMRQRRGFHAAFMSAVLQKKPINEIVATVGMRDGEPIRVPSANPNRGGDQPAPEFLYDRSNWLTGSLLSALALPPELCDASMKRHAIEQWAAHVSFDNGTSFKGFYGLEKRSGPVRLPWSMRGSDEMNAPSHPQWRTNRTIQTFLGKGWNERADGLPALLQERPKDYLQVLILRVFDYRGAMEKELKDLAAVATFSPQVKDIIFAEDAAFNTVYGDPVLPEYGQPTTLIDLLARKEVTAETQEEIIRAQRVRIQVLTEELATARAGAEGNTVPLARIRELEAILAQQAPHLPRSQADLLMLQYGLSPAIGNEVLPAVISALRQKAHRKYQADPTPEAQERLQVDSANFDRILDARQLRNRGTPA